MKRCKDVARRIWQNERDRESTLLPFKKDTICSISPGASISELDIQL